MLIYRKAAGPVLALWLLGSASAGRAVQPDFKRIFGDRDGCFILTDLKAARTVVEYNPRLCAERLPACSTFKVPLALMAFDQGLLKDADAVVPWDGVDRKNPDWNKDQTAKTWLRCSAVWVSQGLTPRLGLARIKRYLADFRYGNQDMSGGLTRAWLSSSLRISAREQVAFLERLLSGRLAVSARAVDLLQESLDREESGSGAVLRGKTGSGSLGRRKVGWFVGRLDRGGEVYLFAVDFQGAAAPQPSGYAARAAAKQALRELGLF